MLPAHYAALNVPVVDAKLQGRLLNSLRASLELLTAFATQLSTLHSYLQQVRSTHPPLNGSELCAYVRTNIHCILHLIVLHIYLKYFLEVPKQQTCTYVYMYMYLHV